MATKTQPFTNLAITAFNTIRPFFVGRNREVEDVDTIVLHWAASTGLRGVINTLQDRRYGYHFLIDKAGQVYQGAPISKVVSHAGNSYGPRGVFVNRHSIGVSFLVAGTEGSSEFTAEMYDSCVNLIKDLKLALPNLKFITGHHWISPGRKIDPYTLNFNRIISLLGGDFELWKTEYAPFPSGLTKCKCITRDENQNCIESVGECKGAGGFGYSRRNLSNKVESVSFQSDLDTD
jgi:hypothetical protein